MEGKRRDEEDMQYSLVLEEGMKLKFPYFATVQGSFKQEEVKQPHRRDTQRPMKTRISTCRGVLICWQRSGHVFVWKGCGKKFKTNNSINRQKKFFLLQASPQKKLSQLLHVGQRGREEKDGSVQLQEEGRHYTPSQLEINYLVLIKDKIV